MNVLRVTVVLALLALTVGGTVASASTAPSNDDFANATVIGSLPFTDSIDMSGATVAADDPIPSCAGPAGNGPATAWYSFTPSVNTTVTYNAFGSSYEPGIAVYTGSRGSLTEILCSGGFGTPPLNARAGTTYYFLIQNFNGNLVFNLSGQPAAPDTSPPTLYLPSDFSVEATGPSGASVSYSVFAADDQDPNPQITCAPPSGSTFPLGTTAVSCDAKDFSGNMSSGSFNVSVLPALNLGLAIAPSGTVKTKAGVATIGGTVRCGRSAVVDVYGQAQQLVANRALLSGSFSITVPCTSPSSTWTAAVVAANGRFVAGRMQVNATAINCDLNCPQITSASASVLLKGVR